MLRPAAVADVGDVVVDDDKLLSGKAFAELVLANWDVVKSVDVGNRVSGTK